jgi:hypothetical protein
MLINFITKYVGSSISKNGAIERKPEQSDDNDFYLKW